MSGIGRGLSIFAVVLGCSLPAMADSLSVDFNSYSLGNLPGSNTGDTRSPGGPNWWYPSNAATSAQVVSSGGNNVLNVYNNGNGNDGVIDNIHSPELSQLAGETGAGAQPGAQVNVFTSSYMFRTVSNGPVAGFQFKSESYGQDRSTWLKFYNDGTGALKVDYSGVTSSGNTPNSDVFTDNFGQFANSVTSLNWGSWYTVKTSIDFVNGPSNDEVTVSVLDASNNVVWSATDTTWEQYYRLDSEQIPNGNIVPGADSIQFQMRNSAAGANNGVFIGSLTLTTAVPLPASTWGGLALLGGLAMLKLRRKAPAA